MTTPPAGNGTPPAPGPNTSAGNIPPRGADATLAQRDPGAAALPRAGVRRQDLLSLQQLDERTKDPNRHYRWVRTTQKDDDGSFAVTQKKQLGYEIEHQREGGVRTLATPDKTGDGSIRMGDLVLMSCPKALRQEREQDNLIFNERRLGTNSETFKDKTRRQRGAKLVGEESEERE